MKAFYVGVFLFSVQGFSQINGHSIYHTGKTKGLESRTTTVYMVQLDTIKEPRSVSRLTFNEEGQVLSSHYTYRNGAHDSSFYVYNSKGDIVKESLSGFESRNVYRYNDLGLPTKIVFKPRYGVNKYKYVNDSLLQKSIKKQKRLSFKREVLKKHYDSLGQLTRTTYRHNGHLSQNSIDYSENTSIETWIYPPNNTREQDENVTQLTRNERGQDILKIQYRCIGGNTQLIEFHYKYEGANVSQVTVNGDTIFYHYDSNGYLFCAERFDNTGRLGKLTTYENVLRTKP